MNTMLGGLLRQAREAKGVSLSEAAGMIGTTKGHLHSLESGESDNPTLKLIAAIVIVYGIRPETIIACAAHGIPPTTAKPQET